MSSTGKFIIGVAVLIAAISIGTYFWFNPNPEAEKLVSDVEYNVVLITFDTTRADHLGCYGGKGFARTPTIDGLAERGVLYEKCYATNPVTLPSHTSMLTGLYPFRHGQRDNGVGRLADEVETLPEILRKDGYKTGAIIGAFPLNRSFGLSQGFDFYNDHISEENKKQFLFAERTATEVTDVAVSWLDSVQDSKFFLWAHYFDPHADYQPPGVSALPTSIPEKTRFYDLEITYADRELGRLLDRVKEIEIGSGRPTFIIMTSDHGESLYGHGEPTHGIFVYNDTIHVPMIVVDSNSSDKGKKYDHPVSIADVYPTVLDRVGLKTPYGIDAEVLTDVNTTADRVIYFESHLGFNSYGWSPLEGIVRNNQKLIEAPTPELYDLTNDWSEAKNLYKEKPDLVEELWDAMESITEENSSIPVFEPVEVDVDDAATKRLRALGYLRGGKRDPKEALRDPKDRIKTHFSGLLATDLRRQKRFAEAFQVLQKALLGEPTNSMLLDMSLGIVLTKKEAISDELAIDSYKKLVELAPDESPLQFALGIAFERAGDRDSAAEYYGNAVELDGENLTALNHTAWNLYKLERDYDVALQLIDRAMVLGPNANMMDTRACLLLKLDRPEEAEKQLLTAIKKKSEYPTAYYHLGLAQQAQGKNREAAASYERAIADTPESGSEWLADAQKRLLELVN